jgi:hypothetical protein
MAGISLVLSSPPAVEAVTCDSVCNQIRRACRSSAKAARQVGRADCDSERDQCRVDCEANADTCVPTCDANLAACTTGCAGDLTCEAGCAATHTECLDDCANCIPNCNADRAFCNDQVELAREAANLVCDGMRDNCDGTCQEPIDPACASECRSDRRECERDAKNAEKTCRVQNCTGGTTQRACARDCRRAKNVALGVCADNEVLCYGVCAGITP